MYKGYNKWHLWTYMYEMYVINDYYRLNNYKKQKELMLEIYLRLLGKVVKGETKKM